MTKMKEEKKKDLACGIILSRMKGRLEIDAIGPQKIKIILKITLFLNPPKIHQHAV